MSLKVTLDGYDITAAMNQQYPLPETPGGILPDASAGKWYNLLKIIDQTPGLRDHYFEGGVHLMKIQDSTGRSFEVKMLLRSKYSARNH